MISIYYIDLNFWLFLFFINTVLYYTGSGGDWEAAVAGVGEASPLCSLLSAHFTFPYFPLGILCSLSLLQFE